MVEHDTIIKGLTDQEVDASAKQYGYNRQHFDQQSGFLQLLREIVTEPMFLLLVAAASIYFITGDRNDGFFMLGALLFVSAISVFQDLRSRNAIAALRELTRPKGKVIRNGVTREINSEEMVLNDVMVIEEGNSIPADGVILQSNDFSVIETLVCSFERRGALHPQKPLACLSGPSPKPALIFHMPLGRSLLI